jgi:DDE superfamily endonuclease
MTQTFVAGLRCDKLTAPFVVNAPMNRRIFETYVEKELAPALDKGDVVIMDNLAAHKSKAAVRARGAWILFLPPYSPDVTLGFRPVDLEPAESEQILVNFGGGHNQFGWSTRDGRAEGD